MIKNLFFNSRDEALRVNIENVVFFEGDGGYTYIVSANKLRSCVGMNLHTMEETLAKQLGDSASVFLRIGKRYIINSNYIYQIKLVKQQLVLSDQHTFAFQLTASREALRKLKMLLVSIRKVGVHN
jgi:DNA-binding LytR/AlgR family response regulator